MCPPVLIQPADRVFVGGALTAGVDVLAVDVELVQSGQPDDQTGVTFACQVDRVVDGALSTDGVDCTSMAGGGASLPVFDPQTGILLWAPDVTTYGAFEFTITASNAAGSDTVTFVVDVRQPYLRDATAPTLFSDHDVQFATLRGFPTSSQSSLADLLGGAPALLGGTAPQRFAGNGAPSDPHRVHLDGTGFVTLPALPEGPQRMLEGWVQPSAAVEAVVWQTGNVTLTQADNGALTLSTGVGLPPAAQRTWLDRTDFGRNISLSSLSETWWTGTGTPQDPYRLELDGIDDRGNATNSVFSTPSAISIEAWVRFASASQPNGDYDYAVAAGNWNYDNDLLSIARTAGDHARPNSLYYLDENTRRAGPELPGAEWIHVVVMYIQNPREVRAYVNATAGTIDQPTSAIWLDDDRLGIGLPNGVSNHPFKGALAIVRQWNAALDDAQVRGLYNADAARFGRETVDGLEAPPPLSALRAHYDAATPNRCTTRALGIGAWAHVGVLLGPDTRVLVNGQSMCTASASPSTAVGENLLIAPAGTTTWTGALADFRTYAGGTTNDVKINFDATANRFRTHPLPWADLSTAILLLDAANADNGIGPYAAGCGNTAWYDLGGSRRTAVAMPSSCSGRGWTGSATPAFTVSGGWPYVSISHDAAQYPAALSVEAWVRPETMAKWDSVLQKTGSAWTDGYGLFAGSNTTMRFFAGRYDVYVSGAVNTGEWTHVVGTYDGSMRMYVNGVLRGGPTASTRDDAARDIFIGRAPSGYGFDGQIGFIAIHGEALDAATVFARCKALAGRYGVQCLSQ